METLVLTIAIAVFAYFGVIWFIIYLSVSSMERFRRKLLKENEHDTHL